MGYDDSFGLPAEQYTLFKQGNVLRTPRKILMEVLIKKETKLQDIETMDQIGFSFDWDREVRTSNPIITNIHNGFFINCSTLGIKNRIKQKI
jgi:leucyl-tRNA synthetase